MQLLSLRSRLFYACAVSPLMGIVLSVVPSPSAHAAAAPETAQDVEASAEKGGEPSGEKGVETPRSSDAEAAIPPTADRNANPTETSERTAPPTAAELLNAALEKAGDNRSQMERALSEVPADQRAGMEYLIRYMPERDLRELSADYLLENVAYAYEAWRKAPWHAHVSEEIFLNDILPYASINERRDRWRKDFYERFREQVAGIETPGAAAVKLNQTIFGQLNVKYSTRRRKADQSPYESIESGLASCSGLSVLLIDACRAVGVPARFAGTPRWTDNSGNHSWVEVWDNGWHFTGAAEPAGDALDQGWFIDRASKADRDNPRYAIFATSYRPTPQPFPLVWDRSIDYIYAVNVTDRYAGKANKVPEGLTEMMFRVLYGIRGDRCAAKIRVRDAQGQVVYEGLSKDERFDANDHLVVQLPQNQEFTVEAELDDRTVQSTVRTSQNDSLVTLQLTPSEKPSEADTSAAAATPDASRPASETIAALTNYLAQPRDQRPPIAEQPFAQKPLSKEEAAAAKELLWKDQADFVRTTRKADWEKKELSWQDRTMKVAYKIFGEKPEGGRSLYISMHGGGNAPPFVNTRQWENQKSLYEPSEGVYLAPRAPTDTWNLWHEGHIDPLFDQIIRDLIVLEDVNPNRVYLTGYSAGGDGVYQLAPRMADRFAAAAMMAGHPNEAQPHSLRNLPFAIHMGANDGAYNRNQVARDWGTQLDQLQAADPEGYVHVAKLHEGKGHWMDRQDAEAIPWMAQYTRQPFPKRIVWRQDDITHERSYWLAVDPANQKAGALVRADVNGQQIAIEATDVPQLRVRLTDDLVDLDQPVEVTVNGKSQFSGSVPRTVSVIAKTLAEYGDPSSVLSGEIVVPVP